MAERTGPKGSQKSLMMLLSMRRTWCALAPEAMGMWRHRADCMQADRGDGGGGGGGLRAEGQRALTPLEQNAEVFKTALHHGGVEAVQLGLRAGRAGRQAGR